MGQNQVILRPPITHCPTSERCERTSEWPFNYVSILVCSRPQCVVSYAKEKTTVSSGWLIKRATSEATCSKEKQNNRVNWVAINKGNVVSHLREETTVSPGLRVRNVDDKRWGRSKVNRWQKVNFIIARIVGNVCGQKRYERTNGRKNERTKKRTIKWMTLQTEIRTSNKRTEKRTKIDQTNKQKEKRRGK